MIKFGLILCTLLHLSTSISNNDNQNLIHSDERRAAEPSKVDLLKAPTHTRSLFSVGSKHSSYPSGSSGYGSSGPSSYYGSGHSTSGFSSSGSGYSYGHHHGPSGGSYGGGSYPSYGSSGHGGIQSHGHSALSLKGLLIPLAGIALLGAAAALTTNPVLLQLGVVNGRKKRSLDSSIYPQNPVIRPDSKL